ncbi:proteasome assembly chaperone [Anaeramoeba flamelloides]|uniref:Proteasome assembly chaperone 2 n=1 Tax=Anaeramoeba flamelloides TaxID=1746091 RepID=A0AAV7Z6D9_9EUKA|nr:proteasome assembly chaperone [Anaeramoeba flamelloides]
MDYTPVIETDFTGSTLILPAISHANLGQLAIDIILSTTQMPRVGILDHPFLLSFVGNDCTETKKLKGKMVTPMEIHFDVDKKIAIIQQRVPVMNQRGKTFSKDFMEWIGSMSFGKVIILTGANASFRLDNMIEKPKQIVCMRLNEFENEKLVFENIDEIDPKEFKIVKNSGLLKHYYNFVKDIEGIEFVSLIFFLFEGKNIFESTACCNVLNKTVPIMKFENELNNWKIPLSWKEQKPIDLSMY